MDNGAAYSATNEIRVALPIHQSGNFTVMQLLNQVNIHLGKWQGLPLCTDITLASEWPSIQNQRVLDLCFRQTVGAILSEHKQDLPTAQPYSQVRHRIMSPTRPCRWWLFSALLHRFCGKVFLLMISNPFYRATEGIMSLSRRGRDCRPAVKLFWCECAWRNYR